MFVQLCRLIICSTSHWSPGVVVLEDHDEDLHHLLQLHGPRPVLVVQPELPPQLLLGRPRGLQQGEVRELSTNLREVAQCPEKALLGPLAFSLFRFSISVLIVD